MLSIRHSAWWTGIYYAFVGYVLPILLLVSVLQNAFTLAALVKMHHGIGRKTRSLFMALAVVDLFNLFLWYGVQGIADHGLYYLTSGNFYLRAVSEEDVFCKSVRGLSYFGLYCSNWLYVLVNVDRLLAVVTLHRAYRSRAGRCLQFLISSILIGGLVTGGYVAFIYRIRITHTTIRGVCTYFNSN